MKRLLLILLLTLFMFVMTTSPVHSAPAKSTSVLMWDQNADADSYVIGVMDRVANPDGAFPPTAPCEGEDCVMTYDVSGGRTTSVVFSDITILGEKLKKANLYEFRVKAYNQCGNSSDWSEPVTTSISLCSDTNPTMPIARIGEVTEKPITIIININGDRITVPPINEPDGGVQ